jgi:hypothetical protein
MGDVSTLVTTSLKVLVIGTEPTCPGTPDPAVAAVVAVTTRLGMSPTAAPTVASTELLSGERHEGPDIVLLTLRGETGASPTGTRHTTPWYTWVQITRELCRDGTVVMAVGVGASVAAIAACVRAGAIGVLDLGELAEQLEKCEVDLGIRRPTDKMSRRAKAVRKGGAPTPLRRSRRPHA